ncbi:MAG: mechanosensitive ion channel domain-containing protein [Bacteroidales bacterium]
MRFIFIFIILGAALSMSANNALDTIRGYRNDMEQNDSMPKSDTTAPKLEGTAPKLEGTAPKLEDTAPKLEGTASKLEDTAPKLEDTAPKLEDTAPKLEDTAPKLEGTAPKLEDTAPKLEGIASKLEGIASKLEDTAPKLEDTVSKSESSVLDGISTGTKSLSSYFSASKIILTVLILLLTYVFLRILSFIMGVWAESNTKHRVTIKGLIPLIRIVVWASILIFVLVAVYSPPIASVLAFSASVGVAVGFASQDLLKNIFGGIVIILDKPFQIGDKVQIGEYYGEIVGLGLRSTRLVTNDDNLVSVPNSVVMNLSVANANGGAENCQVVTEIFLPLTCDINKVRDFAIETVQVSKHIYLNKPISVLFFQENVGHKVMLKVKVKAYVNDIRNEFAFKSDITEVLTKAFSDYYKDINNFV